MTDPHSYDLRIIALTGIGELSSRDCIADEIARSADRRGGLVDHDVVVVSSKAVAKAEGRVVELNERDPDARLRLVESESVRILRRRGSLVITETTHGFICANAGIDLSNVATDHAVLLPKDPDRSARRMRSQLARHFGVERIAVVISDTVGRPWRTGLIDQSIGSAGIAPIRDLRGCRDSAGRTLEVTQMADVDEIAAAAELVMGKTRRVPAAIVRGLCLTGDGNTRQILRPAMQDMFR